MLKETHPCFPFAGGERKEESTLVLDIGRGRGRKAAKRRYNHSRKPKAALAA